MIESSVNRAKLLLFFLLLISSFPSFSHPGSKDPGAVQSLGNGKMCIYEKGPDIIAAYTGPYSSPSFLTAEWVKGASAESQSVRQTGTAIWTHNFFAGTSEIASLIDFVDAETPCFLRKVNAQSQIVFRLKLAKNLQVTDNSNQLKSGRAASGILFSLPSGSTIYQTYVYPRIFYSELIVTGKAKISRIPDSGIIEITCDRGESTICLIGGPEYPDVMNNTKQILGSTPEKILTRTTAFWQKFTQERKDFNTLLPSSAPSRTKLLQTIDDVAVLLKTQQSIQGAVLAGYPYPLGYVRDQYGVSRGLLALGLYNEARSILNFYWEIWKKYGYIHNAQAIGVEGIFHIHENDEVEITGYLILQAFDLLNATRDNAFLAKFNPMLEWAFNSQRKHLVNDMLPFNGDETYVAGGMVPRSALNDGSAEATMLFIESGQKYLDWVAGQKLRPAQEISKNRALVERVKSNFKKNFWHNGSLMTNNPERAKVAELPRYRHGVCEAAGPDCLMKKYGGIVWTERNENDRYVCANCITTSPLPRVVARTYNLLSVALEPFYMNFSLMPYDVLKPAVVEIAHQKEENRTVGYDYGFLLTALTRLHLPESLAQYNKTLSMADQNGAWSEYYLNGQPNGTRYRPWESAINLEAMIDFALLSR